MFYVLCYMPFSDPTKNIEVFDLEPGMKVADVGAGSGHYTLAAAKAVTNGGKIYAIDIQKDLLAKIKSAAEAEHLSNVEVLWGDAEKQGGTGLREGFVDAAIVSNLLFQIQDRHNFALEVKRILKSNGRLLVVEWEDSFGGMGPAAKDVVTSRTARELFETEGFVLEREFSAGSHHYGIIFRKT